MSSERECIRALLVLVCLIGLSSARLHAQQGFCLGDVNGDGHPLFGNPEVMLNPFDDLLGLTSTLPTWGALGDLDGDGDLDAVATYAREHPIDAEQSSLVVLLNAGDGVFHSDARYECGDYPSSVAIGDLNGDGLNDLAVTNTYSGQVSVLINAGAGHFPTHVGYFSGSLPRSVVIADLNGDGHPDLAVLNVGTDDIAIFLNSGSGTFTHLASYPGLNIPEELIDFDYYSFGGPQLSAGDVDGDGDIDLVTPGVFPNGLFGLAVMFNNGHAGFTTPVFHATGGFPWSSALGDLDGDGDLDLVAPNPTSETSTIAVLLNPGTGNFAPHMDYSVEYAGPCGCYNPRSLALGDLDGHGNLDVAVGLFGYDVVVLAGAGNGTLGAPLRYAVAPDPRVVALGDVNGDGHLDLAAFTFQYAEDKLAIRINDGTGALITDGAYPDSVALSGPTEWPNPYQIAFADIDSDADLDVVVLNEGFPSGAPPANLAIVRNQGAGIFAPPVHYVIPDHRPTSMVVADLDGDSDLDVVAAGPENQSTLTPGRVSILLNTGDGTFAAPVSYLTGGLRTKCVRGADLDADGDLDLVVTNPNSNSIATLPNNGDGTLGTPIVQELPGLWPGIIALADVDGDSVPDLVGTTEFPERVFVMFGLGDGTFTLGPFYYPSPKVAQLILADFDGDGDNDLAVSARNEETEPVTFTLMKNNGSGIFAQAAQYWSPGTSFSGMIASADLDLDGDLDVAVSTFRLVSVFRNAGSGAFEPPVAYSAGSGITCLAAGDLDGNGNPEMGTANDSDGTFSILWNRACHGVPPGDLNGDGDVDLLDWRIFYSCVTGPAGGPVPDLCNGDSDLNADGQTDLRDCAGFAESFTGP